MRLGERAALTDAGRKRRRNEDSFVAEPPLFAVADGMGGANAGEVASGLAVEALRESEDGGTAAQEIVALVQEANRRVFQRSSDDESASGMGTTMTLAVVGDSTVRFGHVGDSRAYLFRNGELTQVTDDHSLVGELVRSGKLSAEDAESHPQRSVITRALGTDADVDVDTYEVEARSGDLFILCSDGLYSMVGTQRILEIVQRERTDLDKTAKALIAAANKGGGDDNITVVCFEIAAPGEETVPMPASAAPDEAEPEPDEEETLDEADAVPSLSTMVLRPGDLQQALAEHQAAAAEAEADAVAEAEAEPAPEPDDDFEADEDVDSVARGSRRALAALLLAALLAGAVVLLLYWLDVIGTVLLV